MEWETHILAEDEGFPAATMTGEMPSAGLDVSTGAVKSMSRVPEESTGVWSW